MNTPAWRAAVNQWLSTHCGVISRHQLIQLGCGSSTIHKLLSRGEFIAIASGVYLSAQHPFGEMQLMVAACARHPEGMIAFTTAGRLWTYRRMPRYGVHFLVPHGSSPDIPGIIVHRCRSIDPVDIVERPDGIRLTSPPRTLFDSADMIGRSATSSVLEQILNEERCTFGTITDTLQRLAHPRRPGSRTLLAVVASRPAWRQALQSDLEQRVLDGIARVGLPAPVTQCPVLLPTGRTIHLDFGWPEFRIGLEVDHPAWHAGAQEAHRDKHRDRKAATAGWLVTRITDIDVQGGLTDALTDVAIILNGRANST